MVIWAVWPAKRTDRNGRVIEYTFDNLGRETAELWKDGETTVRTISFEYDAASRAHGRLRPGRRLHLRLRQPGAHDRDRRDDHGPDAERRD